MTIADWIAKRSGGVPASLAAEIIAALGVDGRRDASDTSQVCLTAASRVLETVLRDRAFGRDSAGRLLAADALTTFAFEFAAESRMKATDLSAMAATAAAQVGAITAIA